MLDRTIAPKAELLEEISLQEVVKKTLGNDVFIHSFDNQTNPVIKVDVFFNSGKRNEEKSGLATICSKLMVDATLSYTSEELQETLDHYGAHLDIDCDYDETTFSILCLKEHAQILLPFLKSILTEPLFDEAEFSKIKFQLLQRVRVNNTKNNVLATKAVRGQVLQNTPYSLHATEESINSIGIADVRAFYQTYYTTKPQILLAGATDDKLVQKIDALFGVLKFNDLPAETAIKMDAKHEELTITREGSVQASIRLATKSIGKDHPDYFKLSIANEILGGYFGSRLMKNIREDKGYTYGIYSSIINYSYADYHVIGADVQLKHVDEAIIECKNELKAMQTVLVSDNELQTVKNYMLGKMASHLDNIFSQADNYKSNLNCQMGFHDYFNSYINEIRNITAEQILAISQKYFSQDYAIVKVV